MNKSGSRLLAAALAFAAAGTAQAGVVISQVYGAGGNAGSTYKNDFIELHNNGDTAVSLDGWSIQYNLAPSSATWQRTALSGSIAPGGYYLIQQASGGSGGLSALPAADATGTIALQASGGKVLLVDHTGALSGACPAPRIDALGISNSATCSETRPLPVTLTTTTAAVRKDGGCNDSDDNSADFEAALPVPRNSASPARLCSGSLPQLRMDDSALDEGNSGTRAATVRIVLDRPAGAGGVSFAYATRDGSATAGSDYAQTSGTASIAAGQSETSVTVTVLGDTTPEPNETFFVDLSDLSGAAGADLSARVTINNDDMEITAIEAVQGTGAISPLNGRPVTVQGVVTARRADGFFIQTPYSGGEQPGPGSSGLYVAVDFAPPASASIGNLVRVSGTVVEYAPATGPNQATRTQIGGSPGITLVDTGVALPEPVQDPAALSAGALERYEGMRILASSVSIIASADGIVDEAQARARPTGRMYATGNGERPQRTAGVHPGDPLPPGGDVEYAQDYPGVLVVDATSTIHSKELNLPRGTTMHPLAGVVDYSDRHYVLLMDSEDTPDYRFPVLEDGAIAPIAATQPDLTDGPGIAIASYPALRLFDAVDSPSAVEPVLTHAAFDRRIGKLALAVRNYLKLPDVIGFTDVENLATLQTLAARINADTVAAGQPDPGYAAHLLEGNDALGLDVGYLVKTAEVLAGKPRIEVLQVAQIGKDTTFVGADGNTARLNERPPLVLDAVAHHADGLDYPFSAVLVSQFPDAGIVANDLAGQQVRLKRQRQAEFLAGYVNQRQSDEPNTRLMVFGDFNAPEFNDGYADVLGTVAGVPSADETTGVPGDGADLVQPDLVNLTGLIPQQLRYSSYREGISHQLEHMLVNEAMVGATSSIQIQRAWLNAGFPEYFRERADSPARESVRDPAVAYLVPPPRADLAVSASANAASVPAGSDYGFTVNASNRGPSRAGAVGIGIALDAEVPTLSVTKPGADWNCDAPVVSAGRTAVACSTAQMTANTNAAFALSSRSSSDSVGKTVKLAVSATATSYDLVLGNNSAEASIGFTEQPGTPIANREMKIFDVVATESKLFRLEVPIGTRVLRVITQGGQGDVTLYVKGGSPAGAANYDQMSARAGNNETLTITAPVAGTWYIAAQAGAINCTNVAVIATLVP
ncbi:lamin tail domain-containing protein [Lysobacter enzymogenes]|uniref:lamin tail domain-containing protein n=1 Tax=Lysobacter enzymogenes TaxID=69 RepID=UPI00384DE47F